MMENNFKKRILLCVTGMSPQVVTETLYALVCERRFVPTKVILITTEKGKNKILRDLLDERDGHFHAFCREYDIDNQIQFDESCIQVIEDANGNALPDIRTPEENSFAANTIMQTVKNLCNDPELALHVSIAGGRKSMGFFLGYALSLFARPQDHLSHVLVNEPFENNRDFFYPPRQAKSLILQDGQMIDSSSATVMLADIPLVRLRAGLPESLVSGSETYSRVVELAQAEINATISLGFNFEKMEIICGGVAVRLLPNEFATVLWLAKLKKRDECVRPGEGSSIDEFLGVYKTIVGPHSADYINAERSLKDSLDFLRRFQENCSKIKSKLKRVLGVRSKHYLIAAKKSYTKTQYQLSIDSNLIELD